MAHGRLVIAPWRPERRIRRIIGRSGNNAAWCGGRDRHDMLVLFMARISLYRRSCVGVDTQSMPLGLDLVDFIIILLDPLLVSTSMTHVHPLRPMSD